MVLYFCQNYSKPFPEQKQHQRQLATKIKRSYKRNRRQSRTISCEPPSDKLTSENRQFLESLGFEVLV